MAEVTDPSSSEIDDIRDDIILNEGLLASLEDDQDTDAEETRRVIQRTLKKLRKHLRSLQPGDDAENHKMPFRDEPDLETQNERRSANEETFRQPHRLMPPPPTFSLVSRKRNRGDLDDDDVREAKSLRATPSPSDTGATSPAPSTASIDSFDYDDPVLGSLLGGYSREEERNNRVYLKSIEERRKQEQEDAEFARLLQEEINQDNAPSFPQKQPPTYSGSYSQAMFKPDGSLSRPSSQPFSSSWAPKPVKAEPPPYPSLVSYIPGTSTPLSSGDDSFEEISASDFTPRRRDNGSQAGMERTERTLPSTFPQRHQIPGAFPGDLSYLGIGGSSVYNMDPLDTYNPTRGNYSTQTYGNFPGIPGFGGPSFASANLNPYDIFGDAFADPAQTREELKDLLKHIRPDEDLTPEQREQIPKGLKAVLMPHQAAGVAWMKKMEDGTNKGGILADDMGLGKTLQSIALMLARPPPEGDHRPTLVVAPVALMQQWKRELEKMVRGSHRLTVLVLHGGSRPTNYTAIRNYDVILTTYGTLGAELKKRLIWDEKLKRSPDAVPTAKEVCVILGDRSKFHRVILDEAQNIKNRNTKTAVAACRINATYRWCLSGTPMQNNVDEMYSLIKFCRIRPYNVWERFSRDFSRPLKGRSEQHKNKAMQQLQALLRAILLRRTKKSEIDGRPILQLPEKITVKDRAIFSNDELIFYQALETKAQIQFNKYVQRGGIGRNYSNALVLLLRLRQACCHPRLVVQSKDFMQTGNLEPFDLIANAQNLSDDVVERLKQLEAFECPVCMDANENPAIFECGHALCEDCLSKLCDQAMASEEGAQATCPHCRAKVDANKCTDLVSFLRVYCPEREGVEPLDDAQDDDSCSDSDSDDEEEDSSDSDDGDDLKDFIVPDDFEEHEQDSGDALKKSIVNLQSRSKDQKSKSRNKAKAKGKTKGKRKDKGKSKPKEKTKSLAALRKEGLRNKAAKKKYLKQLAKDWQSSAKIDKTLELLQEIRDRGEGEKTIVFSSFTSFLDLLEVPLHRDPDFGVYTRYDGSMSPNDRNSAVLNFTDNPHCKVILVSLKAGNAGLNLTAANHVIILDPFWNPFVEHQAADRCYRIGQQREVTIHRVLIGSEGGESSPETELTVEDRILRLQEKKQHLVDSALDETAGQSISRLGTRELGYLFGVNDLN